MNDTGSSQSVTGPVISTATWYHVLVIWAANLNGYVYVNGSLQGSITHTGVAATPTDKLYLARTRADIGQYDGLIDEVAVWSGFADTAPIVANRATFASDLYNAGSGRFYD